MMLNSYFLFYLWLFIDYTKKQRKIHNLLKYENVYRGEFYLFLNFKNKTWKNGIFLLSLASLLFILGACSNSNGGGGSNDKTADEFYVDEDIELIVPFGTGGGTDVFARYLSPFLSENIEGTPEIQTVNITGGGSINGANEFVNLKDPNGYNILNTSASTHVPFFLDDPNVQYDLNDLKPVAGLPTGGVVYVNPETGITGPEDIKNPSEDLIYAGISATGLDIVTLLGFEVLDMDVQSILGYDGRGPSRVAFENGESNIDYQTTTAYLNDVEYLIDEGEAAPLFSLGQLDSNGEVVRDPAFEDIPSIKEFYEEAYGEEPSGEAWEAYKSFLGSSFTVQKVMWIHKDAPDASYEALTNAVEKVSEDEEFIENGGEILGGYTLYHGEELESLVNNMLETDSEIIDWTKAWLQNEHDVEQFD